MYLIHICHSFVPSTNMNVIAHQHAMQSFTPPVGLFVSHWSRMGLFHLPDHIYINTLAGPWEIWMKFWINSFQDNFCHWWLVSVIRLPPGLSLHLTDDKSTLVQVMAWCRQATRHYQSQYWSRSLSLYIYLYMASKDCKSIELLYPPYRRIGGCYGFTSKLPAARRPQWC